MYASRTDKAHSQNGCAQTRSCRCDWCLPRQRWVRSNERVQVRRMMDAEVIGQTSLPKANYGLGRAHVRPIAEIEIDLCYVAFERMAHAELPAWHECGCCTDCCTGTGSSSEYWLLNEYEVALKQRDDATTLASVIWQRVA